MWCVPRLVNPPKNARVRLLLHRKPSECGRCGQRDPAGIANAGPPDRSFVYGGPCKSFQEYLGVAGSRWKPSGCGECGRKRPHHQNTSGFAGKRLITGTNLAWPPPPSEGHSSVVRLADPPKKNTRVWWGLTGCGECGQKSPDPQNTSGCRKTSDRRDESRVAPSPFRRPLAGIANTNCPSPRKHPDVAGTPPSLRKPSGCGECGQDRPDHRNTSGRWIRPQSRNISGKRANSPSESHSGVVGIAKPPETLGCAGSRRLLPRDAHPTSPPQQARYGKYTPSQGSCCKSH